jgi:hypothetical protein
MSATIPLIDDDLTLHPRDLSTLMDESEKDCYCTEHMKAAIEYDVNPETCLPCACRFALNAVGTALEKAKLEVN